LFCLSGCWLEVGMNPEGAAAGHLDTGFLDFCKQMAEMFL
jgi:hypothetical protein